MHINTQLCWRECPHINVLVKYFRGIWQKPSQGRTPGLLCSAQQLERMFSFLQMSWRSPRSWINVVFCFVLFPLFTLDFPWLRRRRKGPHRQTLWDCRQVSARKETSAVLYNFGPNMAPLSVRRIYWAHVINLGGISHLACMDVGGCLAAATKTLSLTQRIKDSRRKNGQTSLPLAEKCREFYLCD